MIGDSSMCNSKKQFDTYYQAQRAAQRLNRRQDSAKANPYKCSGARHFHIGNSLGKPRKYQPSRHTSRETARHGRKKFSR